MCRCSGRASATGSIAELFRHPSRGCTKRRSMRPGRRALSAPAWVTFAWRRATANISTRRCVRRCCAASPKTTGGGFYTPTPISSLPDDVKYTGRGVTTVEERDLWDMPVILFLLLTLLLGEWSYRRLRHLA